MKIVQGKLGKCEILHAIMRGERPQEWVLIDGLYNPSLWPLFGRVINVNTTHPIEITEIVRTREEKNIVLHLNVDSSLIEEFLLTEAELEKNFVLTAMGDNEYPTIVERQTKQKLSWKFKFFGSQNTFSVYKEK